MARKKKPEDSMNTEGWLNTYADTVTLLLCFFVMMYTASTPDEAKMQWILRSVSNLTGQVVNPVVDEETEDSRGDDDFTGPDPAENTDADVIGVPGPDPLTFDDMFNWVSEAIETNELESSVSVNMEQGRMHIRFNSDIMFGPDSAELLPAGRRALNVVSGGVKRMNDYIQNVTVEGHTAAMPSGMVGGINDWRLSSDRAASVTDYLDYYLKMVDSNKFQTAGLGQYHPVDSNEQETTRARNRRVELVITRNDYQVERTAEVIDMISYDYGLGVIPGGEIKPGSPNYDQAERIRQELYQKYGIPDDSDATKPDSDGAVNDEWGPVIPGVPDLPEREDDAQAGGGGTQ